MVDVYNGEIDGKLNGHGTMKYSNGNTYVGDWKDDKRHGRGKQTNANGTVFHDGVWVNDKPK